MPLPDEFGETFLCVVEMAIPSQAINHFMEGVETTGDKLVCLNNQLERPAILNRRYSPTL
jgi:hypothetical protein